MTSFVSKENQLRTDAYRKDGRVEQLLKDMNLALMPKELVAPSGKDYPTLFLFGLPRSGTTLIYQLLSQCLNLGYINNLIARFWLAPEYGIALSQAVLGEKVDMVFNSDFGKTLGPNGPHEFAYFWQHWLNIRDIDDMLLFNAPNPAIDWLALGRAVRCMQDAFGKGIVFKTMYVANHIRSFSNHFSMPLFIYIERDSKDVALSILNARKSYYGNPSEWWATYPPDFYALKDRPYADQIAGQVLSLRQTYDETLKLVSPDLVIRISYEELCLSPTTVLKSVSERLNRLYGYQMDELLAAPENFKLSRKQESLDSEQRAILAALKTMKAMN